MTTLQDFDESAMVIFWKFSALELHYIFWTYFQVTMTPLPNDWFATTPRFPIHTLHSFGIFYGFVCSVPVHLCGLPQECSFVCLHCLLWLVVFYVVLHHVHLRYVHHVHHHVHLHHVPLHQAHQMAPLMVMETGEVPRVCMNMHNALFSGTLRYFHLFNFWNCPRFIHVVVFIEHGDVARFQRVCKWWILGRLLFAFCFTFSALFLLARTILSNHGLSMMSTPPPPPHSFILSKFQHSRHDNSIYKHYVDLIHFRSLTSRGIFHDAGALVCSCGYLVGGKSVLWWKGWWRLGRPS